MKRRIILSEGLGNSRPLTSGGKRCSRAPTISQTRQGQRPMPNYSRRWLRSSPDRRDEIKCRRANDDEGRKEITQVKR
jgi:hypothetical protein